MFNVTFKNISVIACRSGLLVEETWSTRRNHLPAANHRQTFCYHAHLACVGFELSTLVLIVTYCIYSYKSNYHMITTKMALLMMQVRALRYQSKRYSYAVNRRMTQYNDQKKKEKTDNH